MCGIAGIINKKDQTVPESLIRKMTDLVAHRGPDDHGYFFSENLALGHRRLSIIDLSAYGHQPMTYGDYTIIFNGEIYNYIEIRDELLKLGYTFNSQSDTEVILAAYSCWGLNCMNRFNGMWAFLLYDKPRHQLICCRDRFGVKPLCFSVAGNFFMIGSEAKQFTSSEEFQPTLNQECAYQFLSYGLLNYSNHTFFNEVNEVPAGHYLIYDLGKHSYSITKWYDLEKIQQLTSVHAEEAQERFRELFYDSVRLRLRSDVRVGACLSGGVDSSSIATVIHKQLPAGHPFYTISSCYPGTSYDEQSYIDEVIRKTGFTSIKIYPDLQEIQEEGLLKKLIWHQDQPLPSMSHFSEYKVFEAARQQNLIVMLDGQGSDEYLAGYGEFFSHFQYQLFGNGQYWKWLQEVRHRAKLRQQSLRWVIGGALRFNRKHEKVMKFGEPLLNLPNIPATGTHLSAAADNGVSLKPVGNMFSLSKQQILTSSIPYQLHSEDRNSMMHSIESRVPFLDYRLVEFGLSLPDNLKINKGVTKYILREALKKDLPPMIYSRHSKLGFPAPENEWMLTEHSWFAKQLQKASNEFPLAFHKQMAASFESDLQDKKQLSPYFRAISLYQWLKVFDVAVK